MKYAFVTAAALVLAPVAGGHITSVPAFGAAGTDARLVLNVVNERLSHPMSELTVRVPDGMKVVSAERVGAWRAQVDGREARWSGGLLGPSFTADFALVVTMPRRTGALALDAVQGYPDGGVTEWPVALTVVPGSSGGGIGAGGILLAAAAGAGVLAASAVALWLLRRRSLQVR